MNNEEYYNESNEGDCDENNEWYYDENNEGYYDGNNEEYYNENNEGNNEEYNYHDIELEYIDTDLELAEENTSLEIEHIEVESNRYLARTDSSNLSEVSQLSTIQCKKRAEKSGDSPVKPFYEVVLVNNVEYWACRHKSCSRTKYKKDGTTSNLWRHLRSKHHISRAMVESKRVKIEKKMGTRTLVEIFSKAAKYSFNYPKQKKLNSNLAAFIVEELQPFSILKSQTLIKIIEDLDSQASVLSKDQLKEILINAEDRVMQSMREHAHDDNEICYISFTTDMWTSDNDDPYIGLTFHWVNGDFQVREMVGEISYLPYPHTAERLANKIIEILNKFQLISKVVYCTADNGANIKSCLRKLKDRYNIFKNFCFGHTLNLVVNDALKRCPEIINIIKKCKDIVSHFSGSPKQKQFLLTAQITMDDWDRLLSVVHDVSTQLTQLIRLAAFFDPRTKDMQIFTDDEKRYTILEAHIEYDELASNDEFKE
ncbi:15572_t:CDS:2, partial [Racocetra fulgida]